MDLGIKGKTALVCASSKGLGLACAKALCEEGVHVFINGRSQESLGKAASTLEKIPGAAFTPIVANLDDPADREKLVKACPDPHILVTNNGGPRVINIDAVQLSDIDTAINANMVAPLYLIQHYLPVMSQAGFGRIINITSISIRMPLPGLDLSSAARTALTAFCAGLARKYATDNITINGILPGMFLTKRLADNFQTAADTSGTDVSLVKEKAAADIPAKRFGDPDELGKLCAFLCSQHAGYINGQNILIDGAWFNATL